MTRFLLIFSLSLCIHLGAHSQEDIFSYENSTRYAQHLFDQGRYADALNEYKRLSFFHPLTEHDLQLSLRSSLCGERYYEGLALYTDFTKSQSPSDSLDYLFKDLLLLSSQFDVYQRLFVDAGKNDLNHDLSAVALQGDWKAYTSLIDQAQANGLEVANYHLNLREEYDATHFKSPFLAAGFSTIVPGLGKIYTGEWKDGLFSMIALSVVGWQSYRLFNKQGTNSILPWAGAAVGGVFYFSNIFGSARSAINVNHRKSEKLYERIYRNSVTCP
jgi:hypothetical protein